METNIEVHDNPAEKRYEAVIDGKTALAAYTPGEGVITFTHTEVPEALEGQGIGSALVKYALEDARAKGLQVMPRCRFVAAYIKRNPEFKSLVHPDFTTW